MAFGRECVACRGACAALANERPAFRNEGAVYGHQRAALASEWPAFGNEGAVYGHQRAALASEWLAFAREGFVFVPDDRALIPDDPRVHAR